MNKMNKFNDGFNGLNNTEGYIKHNKSQSYKLSTYRNMTILIFTINNYKSAY